MSMDRAYWDKTADDYDDQIHDSLACDLRGVIQKRTAEFNPRGGVACDFGCGVGKYIPLLSRRARTVHAFDLSPRLIESAIAACGHFEGVEFHVADLAEPDVTLPRCDFAACTNVLILPDRDVRRRILANMHASLRPGGHLLAIVPSTENALFVSQTLAEWNRREGVGVDEAYKEPLDTMGRDVRAVIDGIVRIEGVPTKHYLREEAELMFTEAGFRVSKVDKVEYDWTTEFTEPPSWLGEPGPWDWLFVVERR